jgi:hypothetical protein
MVEMEEKVKDVEKRKYRYYTVNIQLIPELDNRIEDISYFFIRDYLKELLNNPSFVLSVPKEEAEEFFKDGYILKRIHASKELHDTWKIQSRGFKKRVNYLVNKKLLEVLNYGLQLQSTKPPS